MVERLFDPMSPQMTIPTQENRFKDWRNQKEKDLLSKPESNSSPVTTNGKIMCTIAFSYPSHRRTELYNKMDVDSASSLLVLTARANPYETKDCLSTLAKLIVEASIVEVNVEFDKEKKILNDVVAALKIPELNDRYDAVEAAMGDFMKTGYFHREIHIIPVRENDKLWNLISEISSKEIFENIKGLVIFS